MLRSNPVILSKEDHQRQICRHKIVSACLIASSPSTALKTVALLLIKLLKTFPAV